MTASTPEDDRGQQNAEAPEQGDIEYIEDRDPNPPQEIADPQFDDQGDGDEAKPQQE